MTTALSHLLLPVLFSLRTFTRFFTRSALFHVFVDFVAVIFVDDSLGAQSFVHISGSDSEGAFVADDHFGDFFQVFLQ